MYQSFNTNNSLSLEERYITRRNLESQDTVESTPVEVSPDTTIDEAQTETVSAPESTADVPTIDTEQIDTEETPVESGVVEIETTSLMDLSRGFFKFVERATTFLPFANENIITEIEPSPVESPIDASANPTEAVIETEEQPGTKIEDTQDPVSIDEVQLLEAINVENDVRNEEETNTSPLPSIANSKDIDDVDSGYPITLSNFELPRFSSGQFVTNVQLRLSLGAQFLPDGDGHYPSLNIEYTTGDSWENAGSIIVDGEVSNALNGGYFLFALPLFEDAESLGDLQIRITYRGNTKNLDGMYIDAAWLEIDTETFDRRTLEDRLSPMQLSSLRLPNMHELISSELDFGRTEDPKFVLRYESQRNAVIRFFRSIFSKNLATVESVQFIREDAGPVNVLPQINMTQDGLWTIQITEDDKEKLQPGTYTVELVVAEGGKTFTDTFDFQWGMLAVNPDQTEYTTGNTVSISLAALSSSGNTICDAELALYVIDPTEFISRVPVYTSGLCNGNNVIDTPDYAAQFIVDTIGTYEMYVEHVSGTGEVLSHTSDTFVVAEDQDIWIERSGPTRIYPPALYPMQITVVTKNAFTGTILERVPANFVIRDTDANIKLVDNIWELTWDVNLAASSSATFSYAFDAPDVSPYLYTLGPAEIVSSEADVIVTETVSSPVEEMLSETLVTTADGAVVVPDEVETIEVIPTLETPPSTVTEEVVLPTEDTIESVPEEASPLTEESPSVFDNIVDVLFGSDAEDTVDDTMDIENPDTPPQSEVNDESTIFEKVVDALFGTDENSVAEDLPLLDESIVDDSLLETPTNSTSSTKSFVEQRKWQIASDATGSMLLYWASTTIPTGWTCVSCNVTDVFYQRFVLGSSTAGTNGGASTHTHTATGVVTDSAATTPINQSGGGGTANVPLVTHDHTYAPGISTDNNLPAYREIAVIQYNSAGTPPTIPANAIAIFDASVPTGWDAYTPQNGLYIRNTGTTTIGTTGGTNTHSHTISGNLLGTANFLTAAAGDNAVNSASAAHTHPVNSFTDTVNHEPPYREAILGKLVATSTPTDNMIAMWTDTPPSGWGTVSSTSEPFNNRFVKPSATYGAAGGSATTTHANTTGIVSDPPSGTQTRDLAPNDNNVTTSVHTHSVDVTNYSTVTTLPPYRTAIFAKRAVGGAAPDVPTIHVLFDSEKTGTSTPQFEFTGSDPDGSDTLVYQFQWDDDADLDTSPLGDRASSNETGCSPNCFTNTASSSDTSPFTDGERIRFSIQSALSSGTTYYFRVRVQESIGASWSSWSAVQSFTYESGVNPSQWYQTEGAQFDGGTLTKVATTTGTALLSTTTTSVPTVISGWNVATASPGTSIVLTKPLNVEVGDLLLIIVGNDDNTDTDQWDNTTLKPSGFTLINEAGDAATSDAHSAAFYRVADGTESATTSVPAQVSADYWGYYIRVTGASTTNPINVTGADFNGGGSPHAVTSITTTASNTLAFYVLSGDGADTYPFSVSGTGWTESAETFAGAGGTESAGTWGTRSMTSPAATGVATVAMTVSDSASGFQFAINPSKAQGSLLSPEIDFDSVSGDSDWGTVGWNVIEPSGTDTKLRVYYTSTTTCDSIVPDSALPGNSTGFNADESELFINSLSTTTYNRICLKATFDLGTGTTSPSLTDWTVRWDIPQQPPETPSLADTPAFDNEKSTTTMPVFGGFSADDYENDRMEFELMVDDNFDFSSPTLTKQSSNYPTDAGWASSTFASNATTTYTVQSADALTNGVTYYWRVRARDPLGTNTWSSYTSPRSMTISTVVSVPEWFQTTDTQFASSSALTNAQTTGAGSIEIVDLDTSISLLDAWSLGTTKVVSSGSDRLLVVAIYNEDAATDNINTVAYGGQTLTEIYDQTVGAGTSGSLWVGYLNHASITAAIGTTIVPTWTPGAPAAGDIIYSSAVFSDVDQTSPVRGYTTNALTSGASIAPTASSTVYDGDMVFYAVGAGDGRTYTPPAGYTEGTDDATCGGGCSQATAYKAITANGTELPTATLSSSANRVAMTMVTLKPSPATGIVESPAVDFDVVSGQSDWGEVSWSLSEPAGSDSLMRVYYASSTSDTCSVLIPNSALAGNSAGFASTETPLDISSLSTSTYNRICLNMTLSEGTGSTSPTLDDWTISWEPQAVFTQTTYQWYANTASATPTDTWPAGATVDELAENEPVDATNPVAYDDVLRLRLGVVVSSVTGTGQVFKLQYSEGNTCLAWQDVGAVGSTTALWRGYDNSGLTDGVTLASSTLLGADILESYEEQSPTAVMPNSIAPSSRGEWDFVLQQRANAGEDYCFRMVKSDGTPLTNYSVYPQVVTNMSPTIADIDAPFDNEKVSSTSPWFDFTGIDPEADSIDYQIQIDNNYDFTSTLIDTESENNLDDFENIIQGSDKSPFNDSANIRYTIPLSLVNGTTYWWRVRPVDTLASAQYGEWTTAQSFTVDITATTTSTWFQTTEEQFDTDTLVGTDATASDLVAFASGSTTGTTTSTAIDFDDATLGNAWGEFTFTETGSANDILYHIEYYDGANWTLIPDSALTGNAVGYDTSPVNLIDLDTETYNEIRIRANFRAGSPTLTDWTVSWGLRVSVPTHLLLFDNEKTGTTTPTFTFYTTDPEADSLEYQLSWSTDNTFATGSTTVLSSTSPGFSNITNGGDSNPYNSGDTIQYRMQSALTNGTTYWWRLRAIDPQGSASYSFWSDPWSFTIDTTATTSTWFQTTQEQFDTDTLLSLVASTSDSVTTIPAGVTTYNLLGITNPSTSHVARYFEVGVSDPTDPPTFFEIDTLTNSGTVAGTPNLDSGIAGYAGNVEASTAQYTLLSSSNNNSWTTADPGAGDQAILWTRFNIAEDPADIDQIDILIEARQGGAPAGTDKGWFGIWRPGSTTPYWQHASSSQQTADASYQFSITSNISEYFDGSNRIHLLYFNEDDSDPVIVDYVQVVVTSNTADSGVVTGTPVDFNDGSGPAWGRMSWTDSEPGLSTITYQLEYLTSGGTWALIPDGDLAGNSTGLTTSGVSLSSLDTTTYNEIRPVANFDCVLSSCPTLSDWTITWSPGFTVSGIALEYDGVSSTTAGTVAVAVNGVLQTGKTGTIQSNGTWSISNVSFFEGDIVTVFVNGASDADEAVAVAKYDGVPDMSGLRLQKRHLTIGSDDYETMSNANIGEYDVVDDEDLFFDVSVGNDLTMCADAACSDAGIVVLANNTYSPGSGADVTTHDFLNNGTFTSGSNSIRVNGSWDNNATTTMTGSSVIFTATSTSETVDSTGALSSTFNNVTFGETSGTATWTLSSALDVDGTLSVQYGTLARGAQDILVAGNLTIGASGLWSGIGTTTFDGINPSTWTDSNATKQNIGRVLVDGTSKTLLLGSNVVMQSLTIGANDTFDLSVTGHTASVYNNWINENTFVPRTGTVTFISTTTNRVITAGGDAFYNLVFNGAGASWSFTEADLLVTNDFTIATGTVTMPTGTSTIAGSFSSVGGTFAHNNALVYFTSSGVETISASGTPFTNNFYNLRFTGSGSWSFLDANATTSEDIRITQGTVTFPSNTLSVGGNFLNTGGTFAHNSGTVRFTSSGAESIDTNASFNSLAFTGSGSWSFADASVTALGNFTATGGTVTLPSGTLTLGGSFTNIATVTHNNGTVLFNSTDIGETISLGNSTLYNMTFNSLTGGWTVSSHATTTNNFTLSNTGTFILSSGQTLAVGGTFTNDTRNASTTWTGSTLSLEAGAYTINSKTNDGDAYGTLRVRANTDIKMWNSTSTTYTVDSTGSLYSQDHFGVDGDLYIFGGYERTTGNEYWSYATDFDGVSLGGGSRQVDVRFANGASANLYGALFQILGTTSASTTVQNQGSGTYTVTASSTATQFNFYDFSNLGGAGVTLTGAGTITSIDDGALEPGINAGTGFTVASSTIDANPGLQIYRVEFATTSAISATNVTQTDGAPTSYWWFRQSSGNIDGEAFDNDTGDPGSIRWDDSSLVIAVSGTVYSDDGITPMGNPVCDDVTENIRIVVQGGASSTASCASADGTFSIPGVVIVGDPVVTVYLDTNGGAKGTVVTRTPTADIIDLDIYQNRVITRHEDTEAMTILKMAVYDFDNDNDIAFTAATGTLTVFANTELHIASSTTFAPDGDITIHGNASSTSFDGSLHIDDNATFTGSGVSTYRFAGSFTMDDGATFASASTTVIMTATTTGKTITTGATQEITFSNLEFNGLSGGWNINGDIRAIQDIDVGTGTVSGTADITVVNGSISGNGLLSMGSGTTTINGTNTLGGTTAWTFANLVLGNGSSVGTTTPGSNATTTILGKLTISTAHYLDAGSSFWNLAGTGNVLVENGTFLEDTSTIRYSGIGATNILSTTYYNLDLKAQGGSPTYTGTGLGIIVSNNLTVGGATTTTVTFDTSDPALDVNGNVTIDTTGTLIGSASALFSIAGNWDNNGTYTGSGGTVTFDGSGTPTIAAGNSPFSNAVINGSGAFTISEHATATTAFTLTNAGSFTVTSGQALAVGGTFTNSIGGVTTWTGSTLFLYGGGNYQINASTVSDTYDALSIGNSTQIRMWNSDASVYDISGTASLYSQDHANVSGDLYIYGAYSKVSGTDYWSYVTDFDGTDISGSPRVADVYIQGGSTILYTGGGLSVLGTSGNSTVIQNQGSGTYTFRIGGSASTTWSYYEMEDMDSAGLTFSGTPNVVTLAHGDITVSQNSGSGMTVGGTVITQNPAKTFTQNVFATTTAISAFNVTATGTTASSWRFTNHTGNLSGEEYDVDPDGNPGYLVWDNSSSSIIVSGNVYSDEGSTVSTVCNSSSFRIKLVVGGIDVNATTSCNGDGAGGGTGAYQFTGVQYSDGDSLVVYIDGVAQKGAVVTEDPVSNITGLDIYENRVIVRHESGDPLSILDMSLWDSSDDADVPFTAVDGSPDTLTLPADRKLIVWTGKDFEPNGNVTISGGGGGSAYDGTLELYANALFDATGNETHTIGGSLVSSAGANIDDETATFVFTTTGAGRTIDTNNDSLYNLTLNGSGSWTVTNTTLDVGNDFTITQGAVTLPSATSTITGSLLNTGGSFNANSGVMVFNSGNSETIRPSTSAFGTLVIDGAGSFTLQGGNATTSGDIRILEGTFTSATSTFAIGGNFINDDTFVHASGALRFTSAGGVVVTASSSDLYTTDFVGGGTYTFTDTNVALLGNLTIESGAVTLATGTMSIGGSFLNTGGSFNNASGTILFNSSNTGETINPGSSPFHTVAFASAGGGWTITASATTTGNFSLTSGTNFTVSSSTTLYVGGVFTNLVGGGATIWTGSTLVINSGTSYTINTKAAGGDVYNNVRVGSSTALRVWDSAGNITMTDGVSSFYSQDHAGVSGSLYVYGNYLRTAGTDYWSYATDFDGTALGGGSRQVFVYMASGATTTFTGGTLNIVGTGAFDTTISNQGSDTYAMNIEGGTLNALYYSFTNMNAEGLSLSGLTTVSSLTEGNFTLVVNGGSLITLASTTLNFNAGLFATGVSFATATAITGTNIELIGTTPSAWTFTGHTGNLDGEDYDIDGGDACGSIRWDDSGCVLIEQSAYRFRNDDGGEGVPDSEWFDLDWTKRKRVTVTNADPVTYIDTAVKLTVPYDSDMQADFDDLRFTESDGLTQTEHFIESYTASTEAIVWVKVPTLATSTSAEVYMYYGEGTVSDGSATTTFSFMDNFEDGNISEYAGDTSDFTVVGASAYERTYRLEASDQDNSKTDQSMNNTNVTVRQGQTLRWFQYIDTVTGTADESCTHFGVQTSVTSYAVCLELFGVDRISISENATHRDTSGTVLASTTVTYSTGWYEVEVDWDTDDSIFVTLLKDDTLIATTSAIDSSYTQGGVGYTLWGYHGGWDIYSARPLLTTEPTVSIGGEQVPGGASWVSARNTPAVGIDIGDNTRVRFLIENGGTPVIAQNYEIEFAPKGAAPSCESVDYNDYVEVPPVASCGLSDICMASSPIITNLESTTDVLGGTGTFVSGQVVEDSSNNTGNLDVDSGEYTELEYVITPTINVSDSSFCLRVTNEGSELDAYTRVAELSLMFSPDVTALSLNGGADITLIGGATTTVTATGTVSDLNGYTDLVGATTTIFRSGVGESCSLDNNNCYISGNPLCSFVNCAGNSCDVECTADIYYHADPTDIGTYAGETWRALLAVSDAGGAIATATAPSIDLITLRAITVDDGIDYGALEVNADTGAYNASTTVENIGNTIVDLDVEGTDLTDGGSSAIPVSGQKFATSTFTYSACTVCSTLDTIPVDVNLNLSKPASTTPAIEDEIFWGIAVPFGVAGTAHQGSVIFTPVADAP